MNTIDERSGSLLNMAKKRDKKRDDEITRLKLPGTMQTIGPRR